MPDAVFDAELRRLFPEQAFEADVSKYAVDGVTPGLVTRPATAEDVAATLAVANEAGAAVIPWGSGEHMGLGMPPLRYDLALDLLQLNRVIEYEPADLTVTVEAGMLLSKLQDVLGEHGQWLPLEPPLPEGATIGGVLATNASGASRYRYGTARDLLIGITFALPSGELVKSGGRVVKNVAGYDMGKLHIGALGTLGVITQATFKVAPLPARTEFCWVHAPLPTLMSITSQVASSLLAVDALGLTNNGEGADWSLRVRFSGGSAAVERSLRDFTQYAPSSGRETSVSFDHPSGDHAPSLFSARVLARASVVPTTVPSICQAFDAQGAKLIAYPTAGIIYGAWETDVISAGVLRELRRLCVGSGLGALVLERAPVELKREVGVWGEPRDDFELMRRLKAELDPKGILNRGRYLGGI